MYSESTTV